MRYCLFLTSYCLLPASPRLKQKTLVLVTSGRQQVEIRSRRSTGYLSLIAKMFFNLYSSPGTVLAFSQILPVCVEGAKVRDCRNAKIQRVLK